MEEAAAADPDLKTETDPSASNTAKARFKKFFGVEPAEKVAYANTACQTHWLNNPERIPSPVESALSQQILEVVPTLLDLKSKFYVEGDDWRRMGKPNPAEIWLHRKFTTLGEEELKELHQLSTLLPGVRYFKI
jgi:hypothetical protein